MSYRGLLFGAGASALGVAMFLLSTIAGSDPIDFHFLGIEVSSDEGQFNMVALGLVVIGASTAVASLIASRDDPDRPRWVGALSGALVIVAVLGVTLAVLVIAFVVLLCRDGCN